VTSTRGTNVDLRRRTKCECGTCSTCKSRERARREREQNPDARRLRQRRYYWSDPEARRQRDRELYAANRERTLAKNRAWTESNPEKKAAQTAVRRAVERGDLTRQPCEICGDPRTDAHHDDYDKPLDVRWLCRHHHASLKPNPCRVVTAIIVVEEDA
jgi:hypothetical protein